MRQICEIRLAALSPRFLKSERAVNAILQVPFLSIPFLERSLHTEQRSDGAIVMRSRVPLGPVEPHLPGVLHRRAAQRPGKAWLKQRSADGSSWRTLDYATASRQADAAAQWLLGLAQPGRSVVVLSGNSLEHAVIELAAMQARMPYVPVTPAYSLLSSDYTKLQQMLQQVSPAVVFVQNGQAYERALRALQLQGAVVVHVEAPAAALPSTPWADVVATPTGPALAASVAAIDHCAGRVALAAGRRRQRAFPGAGAERGAGAGQVVHAAGARARAGA